MGICTHSTHSPGWLCTLVSEAADCTSTETSWVRRHIFIVPRLVVAVIQSLSHVQLFVTPWTLARQAPVSMEFSRQEYWSTLTFPSPVDLPNPGIERLSLAWQADSLPLTHLGSSTILGGYLGTTTSMDIHQLCPLPSNLSIHQEGGAGAGSRFYCFLALWLWMRNLTSLTPVSSFENGAEGTSLKGKNKWNTKCKNSLWRYKHYGNIIQ